MTIQSVTLTNFRGFRYHTVALNKLSILVGHNNAGKTTFIDALRLLAVACEKSYTANYGRPPAWLRNQTRNLGFSTTFHTVSFDFQNLKYNQDIDDPAKIEIRFKNKAVVVLWLDGEDRANFVQVRDPEGNYVSNRAEARACGMTPIFVMPPIAKVLPKEIMLNPETVRASSYGRLAYRHFRNQLHVGEENYADWKSILELTWHGLRVSSFDIDAGEGGNELSLMLADPPFVSEVAWVGSGLQAWMQIMWFLCRTPKNSSIVLDEPDAFLHADLQRKLIKITAELNFLQLSIATHSSEIISDVDPQSIIVIKKRGRYSQKPGKREGIQNVIDNLGSRHNLQLSKLSEARRVIAYEGDDQKFLSQVALKIGDSIYHSFMLIPYFDITGVQNWHEAIGAAKALSVATADHVAAHLIIDRDYRHPTEIEQISLTSKQSGLEFHCWSKKEIENFFLSPPLLARYVSERGNKLMEIKQAEEIIEAGCIELFPECERVISEQYYKGQKGECVESHFLDIQKGRKASDVVSGKKLISLVSGKLQKSWGCQISAINLCRFATLEELDDEIVNVVRTLVAR